MKPQPDVGVSRLEFATMRSVRKLDSLGNFRRAHQVEILFPGKLMNFGKADSNLWLNASRPRFTVTAQSTFKTITNVLPVALHIAR